MPIVTAAPRSLRNGEVITEFTDTTSTTAVTYTYPLQQAGISIENSGIADIFVTVGSYTNQVVNPNKTWKTDAVFTSFSIRSNVNSQEFTATVFQNDIEGSGDADLFTRAQLAEKATKIEVLDKDLNHQLNIGENRIQTAVSFIDDDGNKGVYTRILPIFTAKNKKFASAIITGRIGSDAATYMTFEQLKECHNTGLYETLAHTVDVATSLTDGYTSDQIRSQLRDSQKWLKDNGFEHEGFVYPESGHTLEIRKMVREYYKYAFAGNGLNNLGYLDKSRIMRIAFGSWYTGNPTVNGNSEKNTLAYYQACVDYAKTNNIWLIFMVHVAAQDATQDTVLGQLLDYIDSQSVQVVFPSEGYRIMGNKFSLGDIEESHLIIGKTGEVKTSFPALSYKEAIFSQASVTIGASAYIDVKFDLVGARPTTTRIWGNPTWGMIGGIVYNIAIFENDKITIRMFNVNPTQTTVGARDWLFTYKL